MNFERADASYTAWDQRIVAKSRHKGVSDRAGVETPATGTPGGSPQSDKSGSENRSFRSALVYAADHEHAMDPTWRSAAAASNSKEAAGSGDGESFGFWDFIDIVNPLQHIPLVATLYRDITGDEISAPARIMGGALYGGPLGFAASIGNAIMEEATGKDLGDTALAMILDDSQGDTAPAGDTALALNGASAAGSEQIAVVVNAEDPEAKTDAPREKAEPEAVAQMVANNAALQALLKDMGLTRNVPPSSASPTATVRAPETTKRHEILASRPPATADRSPSANQDRPEAIALNRKSDQPPGTADQRKSIPIEPGRFITSRGVDRAAIPAKASQAAALADAIQHNDEARVPRTAGAPDRGAEDTGHDTMPLQASFADRMLEALDRYQAMSRQNGASDDGSLEQLGPVIPRSGDKDS